VFVLPVSLNYLLAMTVWLIVLAAGLFGMLRFRRRYRQNRKLQIVANAGLSLVMLLGVLTAAELLFASFADFSDTFNVSNVSKRWLSLHIDSEKNNEGNRDREPFTKYVSPGQKRIVFIGDSFTVGHGIKRIQDRFTDLVAAWLQEKQPGRYTVANLAEPGLEASVIEAKVKALFLTQTDVGMVVYVYNLNDIEGYDPEMQKSLSQIYTGEPTFFLLRDTYLLNWLYFRYLQFNRTGGGSYFERLGAAYRGEPWNGLRAKLAQLRRECADQHVDFRMVLFPFVQNPQDDDKFRDARARLAEFCKSEKIPYLDLTPVMRQHSGENLVVSRFDAHPNERAHSIAAEALEKDLLSDLAKPASR